MNAVALIEKKRDGGELTAAEVGWLVREFTAGRVAEYQMSAWAMAVYFRGMTDGETRALTEAMWRSGETFTWAAGHPPVVDKHSTGGIGDKTSLVLAPLLACDGVWVPMISGRGLGITGGTLDKLESIPGFRVGLSREETVRQVEALGVGMIGQTPEMCPADRKLYALRDVTGTVPSRPLIVASIMSKKLAEGLDRLSLDVKHGSGAFMKTAAEAEALAKALVDVGTGMGVAVWARLTLMDEPLGRAVGNSLEVDECLEVLQGGGPPDVVELVLDLCEPVVRSSRATLAGWLADGTAWRKFQALVAAQGGDLEAFARREEAPVIREWKAPTSGVLTALDAGVIGRAALALGAGRQRTEDTVDHRVGFDRIAKTGSRLDRGEPVVRVHAATETAAEEAMGLVGQAVRIE
jgi:pyrimidine-nucleoside phosphorylase